MKEHPGFAVVAKKIAARKGISQSRGAAILAAAGRKASAAAKKKNPKLRKIRGA